MWKIFSFLKDYEKDYLKKVLSEIQRQGKNVTADWDAGDDQKICNVRIDDILMNKKLEHFCDALRELVEEALRLPHNSEDNHKGNGIIQLNEKQEIILTYDNTYQTWSEEDNQDALMVLPQKFPYEDLYKIAPPANRAEIQIIGFSVNKSDGYGVENVWKRNMLTTNIRILEGDEFQLSQKESDHLKDAVFKIITHDLQEIISEEFLKEAETGNHTRYILDFEVRAYLEPNAVFHFELNRFFEFTTITQNQTIVLIP
jgi:hypothetical protein